MKRQPFRLPADTAGPFRGTAIDRTRPLRFRLDGRSVDGFAGDSVLSAVLAAGINTLGQRNGAPLGLGPHSAPAVRIAGSDAPLPMERTPATDGAEYLTGARHGLIERLWTGSSLRLDPAHGAAFPDQLAATATELRSSVDLVVVGAGVAGLTAALAASRAGLSVAVLEARLQAGGHAALFGRQEGEDQPETAIAALLAAVAASGAIALITGAEVFSARAGRVRAHRVGVTDGRPQSQLLDIATPRVILATGALERLPVFAGNRLPRVRSALDAFELAHRYGIWPGRSAVVATVSSPAYRLAMLAADAGIRITRVLDSRAGPESRFIAFSRAYGITQAPGSRVATAALAGSGLRIRPESSLGGPARDEPELSAESVVACGGWQPDLTLWHGAGGFSRWQAERHRLEAAGTVDGVALAGSAAGWLSRTACAASGADAVAALLGRPRPLVEELSIDAVYDTPDDPTPIASAAADAAPAFLDSGRRLFERPTTPSKRLWPIGRAAAPTTFADTPQPLEIGVVAAGVQLGAIPPASAGTVAQERTGLALVTAGPAEAPPPRPPALLPDFLAGRFGGRGQLWLVVPSEPRLLDPGSLIQADLDRTDPLAAVGVVVRPVQSSALALVDGDVAQPGRALVLRDAARTVKLTLAAPYVEGMDLAAALGSHASPL